MRNPRIPPSRHPPCGVGSGSVSDACHWGGRGSGRRAVGAYLFFAISSSREPSLLPPSYRLPPARLSRRFLA